MKKILIVTVLIICSLSFGEAESGWKDKLKENLDKVKGDITHNDQNVENCYFESGKDKDWVCLSSLKRVDKSKLNQDIDAYPPLKPFAWTDNFDVVLKKICELEAIPLDSKIYISATFESADLNKNEFTKQGLCEKGDPFIDADKAKAMSDAEKEVAKVNALLRRAAGNDDTEESRVDTESRNPESTSIYPVPIESFLIPKAAYTSILETVNGKTVYLADLSNKQLEVEQMHIAGLTFSIKFKFSELIDHNNCNTSSRHQCIEWGWENKTSQDQFSWEIGAGYFVRNQNDLIAHTYQRSVWENIYRTRPFNNNRTDIDRKLENVSEEKVQFPFNEEIYFGLPLTSVALSATSTDLEAILKVCESLQSKDYPLSYMSFGDNHALYSGKDQCEFIRNDISESDARYTDTSSIGVSYRVPEHTQDLYLISAKETKLSDLSLDAETKQSSVDDF